MELLLTIFTPILSVICIVVNTLLNWFLPRRKPNFPPIRQRLLTKSVTELQLELRQRKTSSVQLVEAYIGRIREVNTELNAVVEDRFNDALKDAQRADQLIAKATDDQLIALFMRYPLLGIPFTVKESCGLKGLSYSVGSIYRKNYKCNEDGEVVERLKASGGIPLLVSANPEYCLSFETNTLINGRCNNPFDLRRTPSGSSGGEAALNGAGASLFGVGSDIGGSIRLPAMFCGLFGHKATGGLVSVKGHFPNSDDPRFAQYLQLGPITRFARDMPLLLQIMAGANAEKLNFKQNIQLNQIKIFYAFGFGDYKHPAPTFDIKMAIVRAVKCFEKGGLATKEVKLANFKYAREMSLASLADINGVASILTQSETKVPRLSVLIYEVIKAICGHSPSSRDAVLIECMKRICCSLSTEERMKRWTEQREALRRELLDLLGNDGVLFFPTFHTPAFVHNTLALNLVGADYTLLFNVLGFPATHIPMGLDNNGLPIGFQVIAAPYQDRLCLQIAAELEGAYGGWVPPKANEIVT